MNTEATPIGQAIAGIYLFLAIESHGDYGRDPEGQNCIWVTGRPIVEQSEPGAAVTA
jgi:hypothetical protein